MEYRGTRWYKCDLHLHTPASKCFRNKKVSAENWVQRCLDQGLKCVAVTDHNTGEWIDEIKQAALATELIVFPGVEITCSDAKVHLLIIFDLDKGRVDVEDFLIETGIERSVFAQDTAFSSMSLDKVVKIAEKKNALIIPAHIDEFNGISEAGYANRDLFLKNKSIQAVQVVHKEFVEKDSFTNEQIIVNLDDYYGKSIGTDYRKEWASTVNQALTNNKTILTFSDNPHDEGDSQHGLWGIGNRYTWIKMSESVSLESLRQALLLPKFRVRNDFNMQHNPYKIPALWIKSIKISMTEVTNSLQPFYVEFSPQLTTIIGGRGTGKSSIFRFLRGVLNKSEDLSSLESILKEQSDFYKLKDPRDKKGVLNNGSQIEVIFYRNNVKYKISVSNFTRINSESKIEEWLPEESCYSVVELDGFLEFFDVDIFSQKQIYEIAQTPNALRNRIDNSVTEMTLLTEQLSNKKLEFLEQTARIRKIQQRTSTKNKIQTEIIDNEKQITSYKESGFEKIYKEHQSFKEDSVILNSVREKLNNKKDEFKQFVEKFEKFEINNLINNISEEYRDELSIIYQNTSQEIKQLSIELKLINEKLSTSIDKMEVDLENSDWKRIKEDVNSLFEQKKQNLLAEGIEDLQNIEQLHVNGDTKKQELQAITELEEQLLLEHTKKEEIKKQYIQIRKDVTVHRQRFVNSIMNSDNLKIEIKPFRDKESYRSQIRSLLQRENGFEEDVDKLIEIVFNGNVQKRIDFIYKHFIDLRNSGSNTTSFGGRFQTLIRGLAESQMDEIELTFPEDEIVVLYKPNNDSGFKPLSNASAGQKTSAILTFILSFGDKPILLDQPEDDLDNHLIYQLIVKRLRKSKEKRQVIIVTHNANIPVNGDAEYVIALNSEKKTIEVLYEGAIEQPEIKKEICEVMEGGETAFGLRSKRYRID
ncbi:TrlF family AAA-like ATPase [Paenibacillus sp. QZ-Y1]|uniref:TrlF family AAA-like ATPase n=1 Tax=Paenibacillus sp. QZ-Y1 TaxID=3414511 RepID=UPI003F79D024